MGLFSITVLDSDIANLKDDSYSYAVMQGELLLDLGYVRLVNGEDDDLGLEYLMEFLLG